MIRRKAIASLLIAFCCLTLGCKRTAEDVDDWRNANGSMAQIAEWADSSSESKEVRIRALQILIEDGHSDRVPRILDRIEDEALRTEIASAAMPSIEAMWAAQDMPELTDELRDEGGEIPIGQSKSMFAKDALYLLHPYLDEPSQNRAAEILREWMSKDQELRTQLGSASIPMLLPLAGEGSAELLSDWIKETYDPQELTAQLRRNASDEQHLIIDAAVVALARSEHPELRRETEHAVVDAQSKAIAPYLEEAILDDQVSGELIQASIDTYARVMGDDAAEFFSRVIGARQGAMRWAVTNALMDARKERALVDIAAALPTDVDAYDTSQPDYLNRRITQICNYFNTTIEREGITDYEDSIRAAFAVDTWPAQLIALQCAARTESVALRDEAQKLVDSRQQIPAWGERTTIGQVATDVHRRLSAIASE